VFCRRPLAAGLLALALLSACGDDGAKPQVLPSASTSSSASISASPTPSTPAAAAEAAARRYYAELTKAYATGDVTVLRSLHAISCPCKQLTDGIESAWAKGNVEGGVYTVTGVRVVDANKSAASAQVDYDVSAIVQRDRSGKVVQRVAAAKDRRTFIDFAAHNGQLVIIRIMRLGD
jgi:hypothetical protein